LVDPGLAGEFHAEAQAYFDALVREAVRRGATKEHAEFEARRQMGNLALAQDETRDAEILRWLDDLGRDFRHAVRQLRRAPGFALAAVGVLALGLGASTALFSVLDRILFRNPPYPQSERLVSVGLMAPIDANEFLLSTDYAELWRETPAPFESVTTFVRGSAACDVIEDRPERTDCQTVEHNFLTVLGVRVALGRAFIASDSVPGAPRVAMIRHSLWTRRFGSDPSIIGRPLNLDGRPTRIIGVLPADFELPTLGSSEVLVPLQIALPQRGQPSPPPAVLGAVARLKPGVTARQAHAALQPLFREMLDSIPAGMRNDITMRVRPLSDRQAGGARPQAWLLLAAVALLMLIACVNVTNLLATRLAAREHEFAVRAALGAGRLRLARLALTESTLLAVTGGAVGLALAEVMLRGFVAMAPGGIPHLERASLDARVLTAAFVASLATGCVTGLWPTVAVLRPRSFQMRSGAPTAKPWLRLGLVSLQIAMTVGMLGASSLLLRSLWKLAAEPLGFDAARVLAAPVTLNAIKYRTPEQQAAFFEDLLARVSRIPGMQSAAVTDWLPPRGPAPGTVFSNIEIEGRPARPGGAGGMIPWRLVTPRFFQVLQIPVVRGRPFLESDRLATEPAMILSESLAGRLFPGEDPIGSRIRTTRGQGPWHVVVGVAKDIRDLGPAAGPEQPYYVVRPARVDDPRRNWRRAILIVRTSAATGVTASFLKQEIAALDPQLPVDIETLDQRVSAEANPRRFTASLVALFAALALLLAVAGLSGTASYLVAQRTREIGVRMALGATPALIARHILAEAAVWSAVGTCGGIALAAASAKVIRSQLVGVAAADRTAWSAAIVILAVALGAAVARPAIRAARTDPAVTLRAE